MKKTMPLTLLFAFVTLFAFSQKYGVYVTSADYVNKTPVTGTALKETSGRGPGDLILTLADGTTRTFKAGTFWGCFRPLYPKSDVTTDFRFYKGEAYAIFTSGELYGYQRYNAGFQSDKEGNVYFYYFDRGFEYLSKGPDGSMSEINHMAYAPGYQTMNSPLKYHMDEELYKEVENFTLKNSRLCNLQIIQFYNNLKAGNPDAPITPVKIEYRSH